MDISRKTVFIAAGSSAITALVCLFIAIIAWPSQKWQATGDGRTIFNPRTGALIDTASGMPVPELRKKKAKEAKERARLAKQEAAVAEEKRKQKAAVAEEKRKQRQQQEDELVREKQRAQANRYRLQQQQRSAQMARVAKAKKHNAAIHRRVKAFADAHPEFSHRALYRDYWRSLNLPFKTGKAFSRSSCNSWLHFLGQIVMDSDIRENETLLGEINAVLNDLKQWDTAGVP